MDREDAALVVRALECRISGEREKLDELAASSLMRLSAIASAIGRRNNPTPVERAKGVTAWPPAVTAAAEIMKICRYGAGVCLDPAPAELLEFIESMRKLAAEPPPNRATRRAQAAQLRI